MHHREWDKRRWRNVLLAQTVLLLCHLPIGFRKPTRSSVKMCADISASPSFAADASHGGPHGRTSRRYRDAGRRSFSCSSTSSFSASSTAGLISPRTKSVTWFTSPSLQGTTGGKCSTPHICASGPTVSTRSSGDTSIIAPPFTIRGIHLKFIAETDRGQ